MGSAVRTLFPHYFDVLNTGYQKQIHICPLQTGLTALASHYKTFIKLHMSGLPDLLITLTGTDGLASVLTAGFRDVRKALSSLWASPCEPTSLSKDEPGQAQSEALPSGVAPWTEVFESLRPLVIDASDRIKKIFAGAWPDTAPSSSSAGTRPALVVNYDYELDDKMNMVSKLREAENNPSGRPSLIFIVGVKNGQAQLDQGGDTGNPLPTTETFVEMKKDLTALLGCQPDHTQCEGHVARWSDRDVTLISGADLLQTDMAPWLSAERDKFREPSTRTQTAAANLETVLDGRKYILHNLTSAVLPVALSDEVREQCEGVMMTNAFFINRQGQLEPAANGRFDLKALHDLAASESGRAFKCPVVFTHGSFSGYKPHMFGDIKGWGEILKTHVPDPESWREYIRDPMMNYSKWACQIEAELLGKYGDDYLAHYLSRLQDEPAFGIRRTTGDVGLTERQKLVAAHP